MAAETEKGGLYSLSQEEQRLCRAATIAAMNYISDEVPERYLLEAALDAGRPLTLGRLDPALYKRFLSALLDELKTKQGWRVIRKWVNEK